MLESGVADAVASEPRTSTEPGSRTAQYRGYARGRGRVDPSTVQYSIFLYLSFLIFPRSIVLGHCNKFTMRISRGIVSRRVRFMRSESAAAWHLSPAVLYCVRRCHLSCRYHVWCPCRCLESLPRVLSPAVAAFTRWPVSASALSARVCLSPRQASQGVARAREYNVST